MAGNSPVRSQQLRFEHVKNKKIDVSIWEGLVRDGKPMPSNISLRLIDSEKPENESVIYMNQEDILQLANVLQQYSFIALEFDTKRRIEAWKMRQGSTSTPSKAEEKEE